MRIMALVSFSRFWRPLSAACPSIVAEIGAKVHPQEPSARPCIECQGEVPPQFHPALAGKGERRMQDPRLLSGLSVGQAARVVEIHTSGGVRRRLQDLGLIPGARVACIQRSPLGDPTAYLIRGAVVALRRRDADQIVVAGI